MKRSLIVVIPIVLLVVLNACDGGNVPPLSSAQWTAVVSTQAVINLSPEMKIQTWLNTKPDKIDPLEELEQEFVGKYPVTQVFFPGDHFQINMRCECAGDSQCCNPEQMFVVLLGRMLRHRAQITATVPPGINWLALECTDRNLNHIALLYSRWDQVKAFLNGEISGAELAHQVVR